MNNKIHYVTNNEMSKIRESLSANNFFYVVELNGYQITNLKDYLTNISISFGFPWISKGQDSYLDWIRDLGWLEKEGYVLIINNFSEFSKSDYKLKKQIIADLEEIVLPFWEEEVTRVFVGGKAKPFNVYLVD